MNSTDLNISKFKINKKKWLEIINSKDLQPEEIDCVI